MRPAKVLHKAHIAKKGGGAPVVVAGAPGVVLAAAADEAAASADVGTPGTGQSFSREDEKKI